MNPGSLVKTVLNEIDRMVPDGSGKKVSERIGSFALMAGYQPVTRAFINPNGRSCRPSCESKFITTS
jgi:hypothetical protein